MKKNDLIKALFNRTSQPPPNMARGQIHIYIYIYIYKNKNKHLQMGKSRGQELQFLFFFFFDESYNTLPHFYKSSQTAGK